MVLRRLLAGEALGSLLSARIEDQILPDTSRFARLARRTSLGRAGVGVGFHKKASGKPSITWPESVDEALCFGWIDGIRKRVDEVSYVIRFSLRRASSIWSALNIRRVEVLAQKKLMHPAGRAAFRLREENRSGIYSYENRPKTFGAPYAGRLKKNRVAWTFFQAQPPGYRRTLTWWVISAKTEATRLRRLNTLLDASEAGRRLR